MFKNKSLTLSFLILSLSACGFNTNGQSIADINESLMESQYFQNKNGSIKAFLDRNQSFNQGKYSQLRLYFPILKNHPSNISPKHDFYFAIKIEEQNPNNIVPSSDEEQEHTQKKDAPSSSSSGQIMLLTFGDLAYGEKFVQPQEKDIQGRVALTNLLRTNGIWDYSPVYKKYFQDDLNLPLETFFYSINNIYGGCALNCEGSTAILPEKTQNPKHIGYSMILWITDSESPEKIKANRDNAQLDIIIGYINQQGYFQPWDMDTIPPLHIDFGLKETEYNYKKKRRKEKQTVVQDGNASKSTSLSKFFSSITPIQNEDETDKKNIP